MKLDIDSSKNVNEKNLCVYFPVVVALALNTLLDSTRNGHFCLPLREQNYFPFSVTFLHQSTTVAGETEHILML